MTADTMNFEIKRIGDIAIFKLNEKRLDANIAGLVKGEFTILLHTEEISKLVIDLSEVESCDSSGLSAILLAFRLIQANNGYIRIASPTKQIAALIKISQLDRVLPVCSTAEEATAELQNL